MNKNLYKFMMLLFLTGTAFSCAPEMEQPRPVEPITHSATVVSAGFPEGFEGVSKGSYAAADVSFSSGIWNLNEALVGTSKTDRKTGSASVRIRDLGKLTMQFDVTNGAGEITVSHAKFGTDGNSTWELWASSNSGSTWTQIGSPVTTSATKLTTETFTANLTGNVRIEIRKTGGGANRINIDDISIEDYVVVSTSPGFPETFESASKGSYAGGYVFLSSGSWYLDEALIGSTTYDNKNGNAAVRIRDLGKVTMAFDVTNGAGTITVNHAKYGSDASSTWELWVSNNSGSTWSQLGSTITTSSTVLTAAAFTANLSGNVRIEIRKTGGGSNRLNIDDILIENYGTPGGGSGGNPDTGGSTTPGIDNTHLALGNPSSATSDIVYINNYLMEKPQFTLSYSRDRGTPNWVAWHLNNSWLGSTPRQDDFRADPAVPAGWYAVGSSSYTGSGFDRGHNCPSADRTLTIADNSSTFLMTNMIPQAPINNQQTWASLESYGRTLVSQGNEVYIIMGSYGVGGTGTYGDANTIDAGRITVPNRVWKVLVVLPDGNNDVSRVTTSTRVIAVDTPNSNNISSSWGTYRTSVDAIEAATGYDILTNVPASIQAVIESRVDTGPTN